MGYVVYTTDVETTGLDFEKHEIIELSMSRLIPDEDGFRKEQETWYIKATDPSTIEDEALSVNGHVRADILHQTAEGISKYLEPKEALKKINRWMMDDDVSSADRVLYGVNPTFDLNFLSKFWQRHGNIETFPFNCEKGRRILDLQHVVLFFDICMGRRRKNYNLGSLVKSLGTKKEKAHRADADVRMTEAAIIKLMEIVGPAIKEGFAGCYFSEDSI